MMEMWRWNNFTLWRFRQNKNHAINYFSEALAYFVSLPVLEAATEALPLFPGLGRENLSGYLDTNDAWSALRP